MNMSKQASFRCKKSYISLYVRLAQQQKIPKKKKSSYKMNPYQMNGSNEKILNCEGCNTAFSSNFATPLVTPCGHFFCQERCLQYLKLIKKCIRCQNEINEGSLIKQNIEPIQPVKSNIVNSGNKRYLMAVLHPTKQIMLKKQMDGSVLLRDFIREFPPVEQILNQNGSAFMVLITHRSAMYKDVKDKSLNQLKEQFSLVTISQNNSRVNKIMLNPRHITGRGKFIEKSFEEAKKKLI